MKVRCLLAVLGLAALTSMACGQLTQEQVRGKQIYVEGVNASGSPIIALLGDEGTEVPASVVPCAHCHGRNGLGIAEGGVRPPNIQWSELIKPYGVTIDNGRSRPPYTQLQLKRAVSMGIDSGGNRLQSLMPRFRLSQEDASNLLAYLQILGTDSASRVQDSSLHIGVILPPAGQLAGTRAAVQSALSAYFADVNASGGVYSRTIDLRFLALPEAVQERRISMRKFLDENQLFALVATFLPGNDPGLSEMLAQERIPMIGAFRQEELSGGVMDRFAFYLYPGLIEQARSLALFAARGKTPLDSRHAVVLFSRENRSAADAIVAEYHNHNGGDVEEIRIIEGKPSITQLVRDLRGRDIDAVFLLTPPEEAAEFVRSARMQNWKPNIFALASLAAREVFNAKGGIADGVYLSFPVLPFEKNQDPEYTQLAFVHHLAVEHLAAQCTAIASARVLFEGLKRSGKDLDREKLVRALEGLYEFKTGITHALTFGPNRRIGALGAYIVSAGQQNHSQTTNEWIELGNETPVAVNR